MSTGDQDSVARLPTVARPLPDSQTPQQAPPRGIRFWDFFSVDFIAETDLEVRANTDANKKIMFDEEETRKEKKEEKNARKNVKYKLASNHHSHVRSHRS